MRNFKIGDIVSCLYLEGKKYTWVDTYCELNQIVDKHGDLFKLVDKEHEFWFENTPRFVKVVKIK